MAVIDNITGIFHTLRKRNILQNYTWMTILNIVSPLIGVILYPFVIRKTGTDSYGLFVFAQSVVLYAVQLLSFGFDVPAAKVIAQNKEDKLLQSRLVTHILTIKFFLCVVICAVYIALIFLLPVLRDNKLLFIFSALLIIAELFNLQFFYQGIGKMKVMSVMSLVFRVLMIPAVFILIDGPEDNVTYMAITGISLSAGPFCNFIWMIAKEGISFTSFSFSYAKGVVKDAVPFFCTYFFGQLKTSTMTVLIGVFIGMTDVAIFDLGNKIVNIFRNFTTNINVVLFPEVVDDASASKISRIFKCEAVVALVNIALIAITGYPLVYVLGGKSMLLAYPVALILSVTVYAYLITGAFVNFVFVPAGRYFYVTVDQIAAAVSCLGLFPLLALLFDYAIPDLIVLSVPLAMTLSSVTELQFCKFIGKRLSGK